MHFNAKGFHIVGEWKAEKHGNQILICHPGSSEWKPATMKVGRKQITRSLHRSTIENDDALVLVNHPTALTLFLEGVLLVPQLGEDTTVLLNGMVYIPSVRFDDIHISVCIAERPRAFEIIENIQAVVE